MSITKSIGLTAIIAIAFCVITSPSKEKANAQQEHEVAPNLLAMIDGLNQEIDSQAKEQRETQAELAESVRSEVDTRLTAFEDSLESLGYESRIDDLESRLTALEAKVDQGYVYQPQSSSGGSTGAPKVSYGSTGGAAYKASSYTTPKWTNNDGRTLRNHIVEVHGLSPAMSDGELIAAHDAWHDNNGGDPPAARSRSRSVTQTYMLSGDCPGGICPAPMATTRTRTVQSRGGLFGFGVLGRRR